MFKLAVLPGDYDGKTQVVLCKINSPTSQPTSRLSTETTPQLNAPPTSQRTATTQPSTRPTTHPSTTQATRPATQPEEIPVATELPNDHPLQPVVCFIAGRDSRAARLNCFAVTLVDRNKQSHVLNSRRPLYARQWYAFAVVSDGSKADLFLSDLKTGNYEFQSSIQIGPGLMGGRGIWNVGCGLIDDLQDCWYQGNIDEIRISAGAWEPEHFLAAGMKESRAVSARSADSAAGNPSVPEPIVKGLADPSVLKVKDTYYLYGTRDQGGFPVYRSTDLQHWTKGPVVFNKTRDMWGESRFWAPSVIAYKGKYFLFYSALGPLHDSGNRHSHRVCIARSNDPEGPFTDFFSPLPLNGKAAIDPEAFVDSDGKAYLYFVADCSENVISQIFAIRMNDDLTGTIGEPVLSVQPSQVWEGTMWNEAPSVFRTDGIYVLMYSAQWWHGPDYAVGFATSRSPLGPWTKNPDNPILQHYRGLKGTGGCAAAPAPDGKGMLIFFHAQGPPDSLRRDTYFDQLNIQPDARLGVDLKVEPWHSAHP
jgi:GH43 family beta-xylosidase